MKYTQRVQINRKESRSFFDFKDLKIQERLVRVLNGIDYRRVGIFTLKLLFFSSILLFITLTSIQNVFRKRIYSNLEQVESYQYAIVFGAGITDDGDSDKVLVDRLNKAAELYKSGLVQTILISGESRYVNYSETERMKDILLQNDIPEYVILEDGESGRTFDTCLRAKKIYGINSAILVSQDYHLVRALYTCSSFGIDSIGVVADEGLYPQQRYYYLREYLAIVKTVLDLNLISPYNYQNLIEN